MQNPPSVQASASPVTAQRSMGSTMGVSSLTQVKTNKTGSGVSVSLESTGSIQYTAFRLQDPLRLVMDFPKTRQGILAKKMMVEDAVVSSINPIYFDEAEVLRLEFALNSAASYEIIRPSGKQLIINFTKASKQDVAQANGSNSGRNSLNQMGGDAATNSKFMARLSEHYCIDMLSGEKEKISLDFQGAQIANILRLLSEIGGFNLILAPTVDGSTNVRLVDVPWNQALELILKNNALGKQCFSNIVRVAPMTTLAAEENARKVAKREKTMADFQDRQAGELFTEVVRISYSDLKQLGKNLETMKSERGRVTTDERTNTLIITDIKENLMEMLAVVENLDNPTRQVMIRSRIVEVNRNAARNLGIQWGGTFQGTTNKEFPATIEGGSSTNTTDNFIVDLPNASNLVPGNVAGVGLTLGSLSKDFLVDLQISALEDQGRGRILSSPQVTTLDNKEAKIQSGRKIPYQTVSQDGTRIEFVDASIELNVTPHITVDEKILMKIQAKKNAADFSNVIEGVPTITTKEAFTEVLVEDSETTVLGGLYENTATRNQSRVPFFADLPILGYLFKNYSNEDTIDELLIFITPTIARN